MKDQNRCFILVGTRASLIKYNFETLQAVESAENLEKELNQDNFFKEYSAVNSLLEERFIDLLLLLDGHKGDQQHKRRDLSGVIDTVEALIQWLKSDGM